ncbi:peptidyl-prolyl cis-trans isomerase H [Pseudovirgaria hyperparasitica]|uniref:Peptidyl-prolyl cis-trans isomerase n=1 Tax=Pseudovirgaria hyperparasitica TaxID=470096 RepID=A0A6A6W261_9PEZI|nr:peptidyl-prolyl cis-trans isomerase H [Pseudovirgaria hyperparasitica]KAF2756645.1 peptidyl-prolyl cis-trans isomerase H [Pseudovirgaria hyperparasitica]
MAVETPTDPVVFLDVTLGGEPLGRIFITLHAQTTPRTAENFRVYCTGETRSATNQPLGYKGARFHRVLPSLMVQGGDFLHGDGSGFTSTFGPTTFADEDLTGKHEVGAVSMANRGPDTNGCQFFIVTGEEAKVFDGKHVVFGHVSGGMDVVRKIAGVRCGVNKRPLLDVVISQCGEM